MTEKRTVVVVDHDPRWAVVFEELRSRIWPVVSDLAISIEHVGSTSVPGLAAKPIVDMSIVARREAVPALIERLATIGYVHRGNLGIEDREAFFNPSGLPDHNLYLGPRDGLGLRNQLAVRDHLRTHPEVARTYGELKKRLAVEHPDDILSYIAGKTDLILEMLRRSGLSATELEAIESVNRQGGDVG